MIEVPSLRLQMAVGRKTPRVPLPDAYFNIVHLAESKRAVTLAAKVLIVVFELENLSQVRVC